MDWYWDENEIPKGHTMPFMRALTTATEGLMLFLALPKWLLFLTKRGREAICGHEEMEVSHLSILINGLNLRL